MNDKRRSRKLDKMIEKVEEAKAENETLEKIHDKLSKKEKSREVKVNLMYYILQPMRGLNGLPLKDKKGTVQTRKQYIGQEIIWMDPRKGYVKSA